MPTNTTSRGSEWAPRKVTALRAAFIALSVMLLLPACGAFAAPARGAPASVASGNANYTAGHAQHHGDALRGEVCAIGGASATAAATLRPPAPERDALAVLAPAYPVAMTFPKPSPAAAAPPPSQASFYSRSTRVLR